MTEEKKEQYKILSVTMGRRDVKIINEIVGKKFTLLMQPFETSFLTTFSAEKVRLVCPLEPDESSISGSEYYARIMKLVGKRRLPPKLTPITILAAYEKPGQQGRQVPLGSDAWLFFYENPDTIPEEWKIPNKKNGKTYRITFDGVTLSRGMTSEQSSLFLQWDGTKWQFGVYSHWFLSKEELSTEYVSAIYITEGNPLEEESKEQKKLIRIDGNKAKIIADIAGKNFCRAEQLFETFFLSALVNTRWIRLICPLKPDESYISGQEYRARIMKQFGKRRPFRKLTPAAILAGEENYYEQWERPTPFGYKVWLFFYENPDAIPEEWKTPNKKSGKTYRITFDGTQFVEYTPNRRFALFLQWDGTRWQFGTCSNGLHSEEKFTAEYVSAIYME